MDWRNFEFQHSEGGEKPDNRQTASRSRLQPTRPNQRHSSAVKHDFIRQNNQSGQSSQYLHTTLTRSGSTVQARSSAVYVNSKVTGVIKKST